MDSSRSVRVRKISYGPVRHHCYFGGGMAHIYRLIRGVVCFLFCTAFAPAFAAIASQMLPDCAVTSCTVYTASFNGISATGTTAAAAATAYAVKFNVGRTPSNFTVVASNETSFQIYSATAFQSYYGIISKATLIPQPTCPANSSFVAGGTSSCACNLPAFYQSGNVCVATPPCTSPAVATFSGLGVFQGCLVPASAGPPTCQSKTGTVAGYYSSPYSGSLGGSAYTFLCEAGCTINVLYEMGVSGIKYGNGTFTGASCVADSASTGTSAGSVPSTGSGSPPLPGQPAPSPCKKGEFSGSVNGISVCVPASNSTTTVALAGVTTGTVTSAGAGVQIPNAPVGATKSTDSTSCIGSSCTTVTTYTNDTGVAVGSATKSVPVASFCAENPTASVCKTSAYSGDCGAPVVCDGDAIQCAIARTNLAQSCALSPAAGQESDLYTVSKLAAGDQTTNLPNNSSLVIGPSTFDQSPVIPSVAVQDKVITVAGQQVTVKLSTVNPFLEMLGFVLVGVTALVCLRVVIGVA